MNNISFLVLDFKKPIETRNCLESIKTRALFPHTTILLDNGGYDESYPEEYYKKSLCDVLIRNKIGTGCGNGISQLFDVCDTEWAILFQNDQELVLKLTEKHIFDFIYFLKDNKNIGYLDLAGAQAGQNVYSERAGLINVDFYKSIYTGKKGEKGGPGTWNHMKYTEQYVQEYFKNNNLQVLHVNPVPVKDCGVWSIREIGDGLYRHRTDTKILFIDKCPTFKTDVYPPFDEYDWGLALSGHWPKEGRVPNLWKNHVFRVWPD